MFLDLKQQEIKLRKPLSNKDQLEFSFEKIKLRV